MVMERLTRGNKEQGKKNQNINVVVVRENFISYKSSLVKEENLAYKRFGIQQFVLESAHVSHIHDGLRNKLRRCCLC